MRRQITLLFIFCMTQNTLAFAQVSESQDYRDIPNYIFLEGSLSDTRALEEATFVVLTREILLLHGGIDERDVSLIRQLSATVVEASRDTLSGREMLQAMIEIHDDERLPEETAEHCAERLALEEVEEETKERGCEPGESDLDCAVRKHGWTWTSGAWAAGGARCDPSISNCAPFGIESDSGLSPRHSTTNAICAGGYRDAAAGECVPPLPKVEGGMHGGGSSPPSEEERAAIDANKEAFKAAGAAEAAAEEAEIAAAKAAVLAKNPDGVLEDLKKKAEAAAEKAEKAAAKAKAAATEAAKKAEEAVKKAAGKVGSAVKQASEKAKEAAEKAAEKAKKAAEKAIDMAAKAYKWAKLVTKFILNRVLLPIIAVAEAYGFLKISVVTAYPEIDCKGMGSTAFAADPGSVAEFVLAALGADALSAFEIIQEDWDDEVGEWGREIADESLREQAYKSYRNSNGDCKNL